MIYYSTTGQKLTVGQFGELHLVAIGTFLENPLSDVMKKQQPFSFQKGIGKGVDSINPAQMQLWGAMGVMQMTPEKRNFILNNY